MTRPFAALETMLNRVTHAALSNATADWEGLRIAGVFDARYSDPLGIANSQPRFVCADDNLDALAQGDRLTIDYRGTRTAYTVRAIEPDGTGQIAMILRTA